MKRLILISFLLPVFLPVFLLVTTGCSDSDDDGGTGPGTPVFDDVVVSLDQIRIDRDCDPSDGAGEFQYKFYVIVYDESGEIDRVLDSDYSSFDANDNDAWDPGAQATFRIERRAGMRFNVRISLREWDGSFEQFSQGTFVGHAGASGRDAWSPSASGGVTEYTLYDSTQRIGIIDWDWWAADSCYGTFRYSVTATEVSAG